MADLFIEIDTRACESGTVPSRERFVQGEERLTANMRSRLAQGAVITTSGRLFNLWVDKSHSDLALLTTTLPSGPYPYAGIPWFATQFGRDAIISALQTLWLNPKLSAGVLRFLAETQAQEESTFRDAQPGKILHEMRHGEMAALKEVPFARYYGSVDSTPLFLLLAARYEKRVGDPAVVNSIWPQLRAAIQWIEERLNNSRTNLLDYASAEPGGLVNQGWKDSADSIFHATGELARGPIAVVEVQGYVYAAFMAMAQLLLARDEPAEAHRLTLRALAVKTAIEEKFWDRNMNFYGLAIDGGGRLCRVKASNAGHLLFCGVPAPARARSMAAQLLTGEFSSGWGIRTLGSDQTRYNPMSYHNGAVWPHDTAICAAGIASYTDRSEVVQILSDVFEAAHYFGMRLPELYCGFARTEGQSPIPYPVACLPQAWSAGAVFMLLQACLGIEIDGARKEIHVHSPQLPMGIGSLSVDNLEVGGSETQLQFRRLADEVVVAPRQTRGNAIRVLVHMGGE